MKLGRLGGPISLRGPSPMLRIRVKIPVDLKILPFIPWCLEAPHAPDKRSSYLLTNNQKIELSSWSHLLKPGQLSILYTELAQSLNATPTWIHWSRCLVRMACHLEKFGNSIWCYCLSTTTSLSFVLWSLFVLFDGAQGLLQVFRIDPTFQ